MHDASFRRLLVYAAVTAFSVFVLSLTTCSIHMNTYNADEAKAELATVNAQAKITLEENQQLHDAEMARIAAIQKMIDEGNANPIAAKCAIEDWEDYSNAELELCEAAAHTSPVIVKTGVPND